jgi:putative DNA primase/helicase
MEELCETFGLQPWLGKQLASFTDARVTSRSAAGVVSQFLRIVGGDTVTVNRKNKEAWSGYLPTRIIVYSNEMLQLAENSNALTGRMLVLTMKNSFFNKEDHALANRLKLELAGIFNWAIQGHTRRKERDGERFIQPASSQPTLDLMTEISNPISAFMDEALEFGQDFEVEKDDLFACYKHWASKKNIHVGTEMTFKRRFLASTQELAVVPHRSRDNGNDRQVYLGAKLKIKAQKFVDTISNFEKEVF